MTAPGAACLGLDAFNVTAQAQSLVGGTEIPQAAWHGQNLKKRMTVHVCAALTLCQALYIPCVCVCVFNVCACTSSSNPRNDFMR